MKIDNESICNKLDTEINRVNCSNQAIDKNINKIKKKPFSSSLKI